MYCKVAFFLFATLFSFQKIQARQLSCSISAESAILINADTGKVLYAKNAHTPRFPASVTKVATALYTIKFFPHLMNVRVKCSQKALGCLKEAEKSKNNFSKYPSYVLETDMSHMGLKVGEEMSFRDLLLGMMIVSADDASNCIAEVAGNGSIESFMQGMNAYLTKLGLQNTKLLNPHGLHHPEHVSTAYDIALLCREAMRDSTFSQIVKMSKFERPNTNKQKAVTMHSSNKLLIKTSPYYFSETTGIKTGYHRRARHTLASSAEKGDRRLIAVVLSVDKRPAKFQDSKKLFEMAFQEEKVQKMVVASGEQPFERHVPNGAKTLSTFTQKPLALSYYPSEEPDMRCQLIWDEKTAPIKKGDRVGELQLLADGLCVATTPLYAANEVDKSLGARCKAILKHPLSLTLFFGLFLVAVYYLFCRKR